MLNHRTETIQLTLSMPPTDTPQKQRLRTLKIDIEWKLFSFDSKTDYIMGRRQNAMCDSFYILTASNFFKLPSNFFEIQLIKF